MESELLIASVIFFSVFFAVTSLVQFISKKISWPYTILLLIAGLLTQLIFHILNLHTEIRLEPQFIYYILLPLLLFESALHMNIHQFKLQFWTISFISTFGLLVSILTVGLGLTWVLGLPFEVGLLFGAVISATDPIAVLAIFKNLGAPKRLALVADGESMFNDATAVIVYKVLAGFVFASAYFHSDRIFSSLGHFAYMFGGSLILGIIIGYIFAFIIKHVKEDPLIEGSLTLTLALGSFILADHYLGMSGVITTVMAGILLGNLGQTHISRTSKRFINEVWEYIAFVSISLVFFFASLQLDLELIFKNIGVLHAVILIVLIARAISVYFSFFISNRLRLFNNEPDVPLSWQHILNWGGLRGVIPLVLTYSLPEDFAYRDQFISFTLACFVFTLLINGLTIRWLLVKLKLHLPKKEEEIIKYEQNLFEIEQKLSSLQTLQKNGFNKEKIKEIEIDLKTEEKYNRSLLLNISNKEELNTAIRLQTVEIVRKKLLQLYYEGFISIGAFQEYESQLDLRQDAFEHPEVFAGRGYSQGRVPNRKLFRQRIKQIRSLLNNFPILRLMFNTREQDVVLERLMILNAKVVCANEVLDYLNRFKRLLHENSEALTVLNELRKDFEGRIKDYQEDITEIKKDYPIVDEAYQSRILSNLSLR